MHVHVIYARVHEPHPPPFFCPRFVHPRQTEPYMPEYMNLDMNSALEEVGFELLEVRNTSPSHIAIVARKV